MGCVASRLEEEEEVVSICRERKHHLKLAVERRYALADAHYRYCQSLFGVSAAINLFVARHSKPPSPFYITFPSPSSSSPLSTADKDTVVSNPLFFQQAPSEPTKQAITCDQSCTTTSSASSVSSEGECHVVENKNEKQEPAVCGYFYMDMPPEMVSPGGDFGWDFFNPFDSVTRPEVMSVYNRISEEDLRAVRDQEGIPDLEDEEERNITSSSGVAKETASNGNAVTEQENVASEAVNNTVVESGEEIQKGLTVIDTPVGGRELLEALKDIEDHFARASDSGKEVSRMLECNRVHLQSNLEEIKESSTKLIQAIVKRSASSRSSSCKSLVASGSKSSSTTWTEFSNDLFDDYGGMNSGSHSLTLGRLYAWEKKLYEEVKDGDSIRKLYERKCNQLRNHDDRGDERMTSDKTRAAVKDLYSRILVAIRSAETISNNIDKLRDEELGPQIRELQQGMMRTWKIMLESHEIQNKIIFEVKSFTCPSYGKFCNESHRLATIQLETELLNWRSCFIEYVAAQRGFIEALCGWLSKFVAPEVEFYSRGRASNQPPCCSNGPLLLRVCRDWLDSMNKLPDKAVSYAMKSCAKDVRLLWFQQGEEHQQKKKVDSLSKELDKRIMSYKKAERRVEFRLTDKYTEVEMEHQADSMIESKDMLDSLRRRVDLEKEKHHKLMEETQRITLNGFQTGFCGVFESMTEFSRAAVKMYNDLNTIQNAENVDSVYRERTKVQENGSR